MASKELLAKDKRRWSKRKGITAGIAVVGGLALVGIGYLLYRKIIVDAPPKSGERKDWSGCFEPPDWVQPRPTFSCGQKVADSLQNESGHITARTWSPSGSTEGGQYLYGQWLYEMMGSDNVHEEGNLQVA